MWNLVFLFTGMFFIILLLWIFLSKEVVKNNENKTFKLIAIFNLIGYISEISLQLVVRKIGGDSFLAIYLAKLYLVVIFVWFSIFSVYTIIIGLNKDDAKKYNKQFNTQKLLNTVSGIVGSILLVSLPIEIFYDGTKMYSFGISVDVLKILLGLYLFVWIGILLFNIKKLKDKRFIPMFVVVGLLILNVILSTIDPGILISTMVGTFVCYTMFFTIENPDLKMLNEYIKNKELVETSAEEKSNVLFKISQEVRTPIRKINLLGNNIMSSREMNVIHDNARNIVNISSSVNNIINNVLDITDLDKRSVKITDTTYNIYNLFSQLVYFGKEKADKVEFKYSINNIIPKELRGDSTRLKQIICSILYNAFKNTEQGYVDLNISNIIKYDICRLIITVSDTGKGMSLETINNILEDTSEINKEEIEQLNEMNINLKLVKKLIDIQGGSMMISSDERGTTFTVVLDQSFEDKNDFNYINDASKDISNKQRVLIVDDDYTELTHLSKEFKRNSFDVVTTMYGKDCVDKIANNEKYDYIIIDDEMDKYNAVHTIRELQKVCDVSNLNVIVLLGRDKEAIKEHYLEDYPFKDYLLKDNYKEEIKRIKDSH